MLILLLRRAERIGLLLRRAERVRLVRRRRRGREGVLGGEGVEGRRRRLGRRRRGGAKGSATAPPPVENSVCIWCPLAWTDCIIALNSLPVELTGPDECPLKLAPGLGGMGT